RGREIRQHHVGHRVLHHRAGGHVHHEIRAIATGAVVARTGTTAFGAVSGPFAAVEKRAHVGVHLQHDAAALAAVAAVGPALGHVLLAPEADAPVAAASRLHVDLRLIVEHALT